MTYYLYVIIEFSIVIFLVYHAQLRRRGVHGIPRPAMQDRTHAIWTQFLRATYLDNYPAYLGRECLMGRDSATCITGDC